MHDELQEHESGFDTFKKKKVLIAAIEKHGLNNITCCALAGSNEYV